jgi:hypothetical protein
MHYYNCRRAEHNKTTSSSAKLNRIYKYKAGSKGIHDKSAQDYSYSRYKKDGHQKSLDNKKQLLCL